MNLTRISIGIATVAILVVVALGWLLGVGPRLAEAHRLDEERSAVEAQNEVGQAALTQLAADFDRRDEVLAELDTTRTLVPTSPDIESFLSEIADIAVGTGVSLGSYAASEAVAYTGTGVESTPAAAAAAPATGTAAPAPSTPASGAAVIPDASSLGLYYVPFTMTITGGPDQIMRFVGAVQEGPRLFISPSVTLSGAESGGSPTATLTGYIFALPVATAPTDPAGATAPAAAPAAAG